MRTLIPLAFLTFLFATPLYSQVNAIGEKEPTGKITAADFEGHWRGEEKCQNISAPVSQIVITSQGGEAVMISGL